MKTAKMMTGNEPSKYKTININIIVIIIIIYVSANIDGHLIFAFCTNSNVELDILVRSFIHLLLVNPSSRLGTKSTQKNKQKSVMICL